MDISILFLVKSIHVVGKKNKKIKKIQGRK